MPAMTSPDKGGAAARLVAAQSVGDLRQGLLSTVPIFANGPVRELAVLGAGPEGLRLVDICRREKIRVAGVYDGNARKRGTKLGGMTVYPEEAIAQLPKDIPIVVASHRVLGACQSLRAQGYVAVPLGFLQVGMPQRFPPHPFYDGLLEDLFDNREKYLSLFEVFPDDTSKQVLDAVLTYRLSMNPLCLQPVIDWDLYGSIRFGSEEIYIDGGTYNGDSIQLFMEHVGGQYAKIYGFEPDERTFKVLQERLGGVRGIELHNSGLHSTSGTLGFSADSSRGAKIDEQSATRIKVVRLDDVVSGGATFIKMNIEGAEIEALKGARRLIASSAPKLVISAYHRPSDLWHLPALIRELNKAYSLSLRQHDGGIIETVIYACA